MRVSLATRSADQISGHVLTIAGGLCGVLVFFVAVPLALSSPYPTLKDGAWAVQRSTFDLASSSIVPKSSSELAGFELASAGDVPVVIKRPLTTQANADPDAEQEIVPPPFRVASLAPTAAAEAGYVGPALEADPDTTGSVGKIDRIEKLDKPLSPLRRPVSITEEVDQYLWEVYQRAPVKRDSSGDFTWKDPAAAKRLKMAMPIYAIGGMDPDFREQLYHAGRAMDAAGIRWSMLSAFRDDYRQALASGFKARPGNSLHGGSRRTGGYGHGQAADLTGADGNASAVWRWIDAHGSKYGLVRPMPGADPAHVQPRGTWHNIAVALRDSRVGVADATHAPGTRTAARRARSEARRSM